MRGNKSAHANAIGCLLLAISVFAQAEPPKTREEVNAITRRNLVDPTAFLELKGASLDLIMPYLTDLWFASARAARQLEECRQGGNEKEFIASEKARERDVVGLANRLPMIQNILMSDPNFEWTVASKLRRMTYDLNQTYEKTKFPASATDLVQEMEFAALIPGDAAIRIVGPCLEAPYFPLVADDDYLRYSPAERAREILARVVKKRYRQEIPADIEAARAWWKENEHRFAEKPSTPGVPGVGASLPKAIATAAGQSPSPPKVSAATAQEPSPSDEPSRTQLRWTIGTLLSATLAAVLILIFRAKKQIR